jgi:hypothetical protein
MGEANSAGDQSTGYDVFISYSHKDREWVRDWLLPRLEEAGLKVCIDYRDFAIGVPILVNIERAVERSRRTLLVLTPDWVSSQWTNFESMLLQTEDPTGLRQSLLPLMLEECEPPPRLGILTYADFRARDNWESELARLLEQIGAPELPPPNPTAPHRSPWPSCPPPAPTCSGARRNWRRWTPPGMPAATPTS